MNGIVFDIKRFAIHDGPGIRTTVFLKGCPLRCRWCHNPESQHVGVETFATSGGDIVAGRSWSVGELMREIRRDTLFYDESGGGVTFSGGEPLAQPEFLLELLSACGREEIHRAVDTSGAAPADVIREVARNADLMLYDLKLADTSNHARETGTGCEIIHANLNDVCAMNVAIELRIPLVPGITDTTENLTGLAAIVSKLPCPPRVRLLRYHRAAMDKYIRFGRTPPLPNTPEPAVADVQRAANLLRTHGLEVIV